MSGGGGAGDGAARAARAEVRLRVAPVSRQDAERLRDVLQRLPAVEAIRLELHADDTATYTLSAHSVARLVAELGEVADRSGAALTRTITGEVVLALPADGAPPVMPDPAAAGEPAVRAGGAGVAVSPLDAASAGSTAQAVIGGTERRLARRSRPARRPQLHAVPHPDAPRGSTIDTLRRRASAWNARRIGWARRRRVWRGPLALVVFAGLIALALTLFDTCGSSVRGTAVPDAYPPAAAYSHPASAGLHEAHG